MPFKGPGIYEIVPYQVPQFDCNSWGGSTDPGEVVKIAERSKPPGLNCQWLVALAKGTQENGEYIIMNVRNGYLLKAGEKEKNVTSEHVSPNDPTARWKLTFSPSNGYDTWTINAVSGGIQLNVRASGQTSGSDVINYPVSGTDNTKWYFDPVN